MQVKNRKKSDLSDCNSCVKCKVIYIDYRAVLSHVLHVIRLCRSSKASTIIEQSGIKLKALHKQELIGLLTTQIIFLTVADLFLKKIGYLRPPRHKRVLKIVAFNLNERKLCIKEIKKKIKWQNKDIKAHVQCWIFCLATHTNEAQMATFYL